MDDRQDPKTLSRRSFLDYSIRSIGAFITAVVTVPIIGYVVSPALAKKETPWVQIGPVTEFTAGQPKLVEFTRFRQDGWVEVSEKKTVWVVRNSSTEFAVLSPRCTHLGCAYNWQPDKKQFLCPCHSGVFDVTGKVLSGPPPRRLDSLEYKVENNTLSCIYKDFQLGVEEKVEI